MRMLGLIGGICIPCVNTAFFGKHYKRCLIKSWTQHIINTDNYTETFKGQDTEAKQSKSSEAFNCQEP